jgi:hypothetical protein
VRFDSSALHQFHATRNHTYPDGPGAKAAWWRGANFFEGVPMYKIEAKSAHEAVEQLFTQFATQNQNTTGCKFVLDGGHVSIRVNKKKPTRLKSETR